jgi:hypothetical protein
MNLNTLRINKVRKYTIYNATLAATALLAHLQQPVFLTLIGGKRARKLELKNAFFYFCMNLFKQKRHAKTP